MITQCMGLGIRKNAPTYRAAHNVVTNTADLKQSQGEPERVHGAKDSQLWVYDSSEEKRFFQSYWLIIPIFFHWSKPDIKNLYVVSRGKVLAKLSNKYEVSYGPFCSFTIPLPMVGGGSDCLPEKPRIFSEKNIPVDQCSIQTDAHIELTKSSLKIKDVSLPAPNERLVQLFRQVYEIKSLFYLEKYGIEFYSRMYGRSNSLTITFFEEHSRYLQKSCTYSGKFDLLGFEIDSQTTRQSIIRHLEKLLTTDIYDQQNLVTFSYRNNKVRMHFTLADTISRLTLEQKQSGSNNVE